MLDLFLKLPWYLILLTVILIIIPAIVTTILRISLYGYIADLKTKISRLVKGKIRGTQPEIIEKLETRFEKASHQLEQVNTPALIDGVYSEEHFKFFGFDFSCEQWDYFCNVLPNLLLTFGLLGTVLGIALNLSSLSQTLDPSSDLNVSEFITNLERPLESMGIAFSTSLVALVFSSILTIINWRFNTKLAKYWLISYLEDYLDNIYKPTVEGDTRLDKAVNKMVEQQNEFLLRFHEKVGAVLETTFGQAANQIAVENKKASDLAQKVYTAFMDSSGTLNTGANTFKNSAISLENQVKEIANNIMPKLTESAGKIESGAGIFDKAADKIEKSKFSENLEKTTKDLAEIHTNFANSTQILTNSIEEFISTNRETSQLAKEVYGGMQASSEKLENSADVFEKAVTKIDSAATKIEETDFPERLSGVIKEIESIQQEFTNSVSGLKQSTETLTQYSQNLISLKEGITNLNSQFVEVITLIQEKANNQETILNKMDSQISEVVKKFINFENQTLSSIEILKISSNGILNLGSRISELNTKFETITQLIENETIKEVEGLNKLEQLLIKIEKQLKAVDNSNSSNNKILEQNSRGIQKGLNDIGVELVEMKETLTNLNISSSLTQKMMESFPKKMDSYNKVIDTITNILQKINSDNKKTNINQIEKLGEIKAEIIKIGEKK